MLNTPILFLIFNRPDVTRILFERIREVKPKKLYVAADGPRATKPGEAELCEATRDITGNIDWPCEVKTLFREKNLGCGKAVSEAITWFFEQEETGIILEDDCLPVKSFFPYCEELLEKYKNDERVFHIGGVNFQNGQKRGDGDYYFSAVAHVWGWASWRRAWNKYRFDIPGLSSFLSNEKLKNYFDNKVISDHWAKTFVSIEKHEIDTWDHQWTYTIFNNGGLSVIPNVNMVSNIGFGADATHTKNISQYANLLTKDISFPIRHPSEVKLDKEADLYFFRDFDKLIENVKYSKPSLAYKIKNKIITRTESFLRKNILSRPHNKNSNNILIVKPDAIGDFFIFQWLFRYLDKYPDFKKYDFYLLANIRLKSYLDVNKPAFIKEIIYYDPSMHKRFKSLYGFYFSLRKYRFDTVYNLLFSRTRQVDELVLYTGAKNKIGFSGDTANLSKEEKMVSDRYYSRLIDIPNDATTLYHESERMKFFMKDILKISIPSFSDSYLTFKDPVSSTVVVSPGSNEEYKKWNPINFAQLINLLSKEFPAYTYKIVCGPGEENLGEIIASHCKNAIVENVNDINKLVKSVATAQLTISNDSAPTHIAVAYGRPYVCIFNGSRYARFLPYMFLHSEKYRNVMPDRVDKELEEESKRLFYHQNKVNVNINEVPVEKVLDACRTILNSNV